MTKEQQWEAEFDRLYADACKSSRKATSVIVTAFWILVGATSAVVVGAASLGIIVFWK